MFSLIQIDFKFRGFFTALLQPNAEGRESNKRSSDGSHETVQ